MKSAISILLLLLSGLMSPLSLASAQETPSMDGGEMATEPKTLKLLSRSVIRTAPDGPIIDVWDAGALLTSRAVDGDWLRISGYFPDNGDWKPSQRPLWISRHYVDELPPRKTEKHKSNRPDGLSRYIVIDKSDFELKLIEKQQNKEKVVLKTTVAVGMDRCMPKEKGGRCYYTDPGEYKVRWKVHDPKGIEWCIPKSMEKEYPEDIAAGRRCFRGSIGTHALNIGKSYAIHGTSNPASLGKKASHGCVRARNDVMARIYSLMENGDKVLIVD